MHVPVEVRAGGVANDTGRARDFVADPVQHAAVHAGNGDAVHTASAACCTTR